MLTNQNFERTSRAVECVGAMHTTRGVARYTQCPISGHSVSIDKLARRLHIEDLPIIARLAGLFAVTSQLSAPHELLSHLSFEHVDVLDEFVADEHVQALRLLVVDLDNEILPCRSMGQSDAHFLGICRGEVHRVLRAHGNRCGKRHEPFQTCVAKTPPVVHLAIQQIRVAI